MVASPAVTGSEVTCVTCGYPASAGVDQLTASVRPDETEVSRSTSPFASYRRVSARPEESAIRVSR